MISLFNIFNGQPIKKDPEAAGPRVMAYIGDDDPHRGDSKAAQGLARVVADMLNGTYVYVDRQTIKQYWIGSYYTKIKKLASRI